jgi:lysophospholipase L1-like esterase
VHRSDSLARVVNLAVPGYTTYHLLPTGNSAHEGRPAPDPEHNITRALTFKPDVLIINLPSNDANNGYPVREQLANYDVIRAQITNPGTLLFVSTTQPRNIPDAAGRKLLMEMRDSSYARFGSHAMDFWTGLGNPDGSLKAVFDSGDGIHLNNAGHRILFERALSSGVLK